MQSCYQPTETQGTTELTQRKSTPSFPKRHREQESVLTSNKTAACCRSGSGGKHPHQKLTPKYSIITNLGESPLKGGNDFEKVISGKKTTFMCKIL